MRSVRLCGKYRSIRHAKISEIQTGIFGRMERAPRFIAQNKTEPYTICLFDSQILFCKRAGSVDVNAVKHYLKRLWLVSIATTLSKTFNIGCISTQLIFLVHFRAVPCHVNPSIVKRGLYRNIVKSNKHSLTQTKQYHFILY